MRRLTRREFAAAVAQGTSLAILLRDRARAQEGDGGGGDAGDGGDSGDAGEGDEGGGDAGDDTGSDDGSDGGEDDTDAGESGDLIDEATGDRTLASSDVCAATSDPTTDLSDTEWGGLFDTNSDENSCIDDGEDGIADEIDDATPAESNAPGFWDSSWFSFHFDAQIGPAANPAGLTGSLTTDPEIGSLTGTIGVQIGEGGFYGTTSQGYDAFGAYLGVQGEASVFAEVGEYNNAPSLFGGIDLGPAQLSVGVDAGPMVEAGGRALGDLERGVYDYTNTMNSLFGDY